MVAVPGKHIHAVLPRFEIGKLVFGVLYQILVRTDLPLKIGFFIVYVHDRRQLADYHYREDYYQQHGGDG